MSRKLLSTIDDQIEGLENRGFTASVIVLSMTEYQELVQFIASRYGQEQVEAHTHYKKCLLVAITAPDILEVVPDIREMWERGEEFMPPPALPGIQPESLNTRTYVPGTPGSDDFSII